MKGAVLFKSGNTFSVICLLVMYPECYTEALTCVELVLWSFVDCDGEYNLEFDSD